MFYEATSFNQDINNWDTALVRFMYRASALWRPASCTVYPTPLSPLRNECVELLGVDAGTFYLATAFNQDVGNWDTTSVTDERGMLALWPPLLCPLRVGAEGGSWVPRIRVALACATIGPLLVPGGLCLHFCLA